MTVKSDRKPISWVVLLCVCLLTAGCKTLTNFFAFHPDSSLAVPAESLPPNTEEIRLETEDGIRIQALHFRHPSSETMTIYFHGNAGNVYYRLADYVRLRQLGTSVFAVSYRGYGKSDGSPSEDGIYLDGEAAFAYVVDELGIPPSRIFVLGRSIGSTVATHLAQDRDIAGLILVSPLSNARDQASAMGLGFASSLAGQAFQNDRKIRRLRAPLLVVHGTRDRVIPIDMGRKVFDAAPGRKSFHKIEGAGHNDLSGAFADRYWNVIADFLNGGS